MPGGSFLVLTMAAFVGLLLMVLLFFASRYKRCPSNRILVVYGKVGAGVSARCLHGGAASRVRPVTSTVTRPRSASRVTRAPARECSAK